MKSKLPFIIAIVGIVIAIISVPIFNARQKTQPPIAVNYNPFSSGIYANGIIESYQTNGTNINIYPEVSGKVTKIFTGDGQSVAQGNPLIAIDDSIQKEIVDKDSAQVNAALSALNELKSQPRKENLDVAKAQLDSANATLVQVQTQTEKVQKSYQLYPGSISKDALDNAINALSVAQKNVKVAQAQYNLVSAGAWSYDIENAQNQYQAALQTYKSDQALLDKYIIKSPVKGVVLRLNAEVGDYISPQGIFDPYTQGMNPVIQLASTAPYLQVRCFLNEILVPKLPQPSQMQAILFIRGGTNQGIPLEFVRIQPYTIPNIQLSDERSLRVDVRVLPIIFKFKVPVNENLYPGQLVDVYIKAK